MCTQPGLDFVWPQAVAGAETRDAMQSTSGVMLGAAGMAGRASAAAPWHGDLRRGCRCFPGLWLHSPLAFLASVLNNWCASVEPEPTLTNQALPLERVRKRGLEGVAEGEAAFCCS